MKDVEKKTGNSDKSVETKEATKAHWTVSEFVTLITVHYLKMYPYNVAAKRKIQAS